MNPSLPKLTVDEATQIKKRFQAILDDMDVPKKYSYIPISIGCPHCEKAYYKAIDLGDTPINYNCKYCDYQPIGCNRVFQCCMYEFNGVKYTDIKEYLRLSNFDIVLYINWKTKETEIRAFCQGHISWAEEYLHG